MIQVADGVICETSWEGANVGAVGTGNGVVLIDSPMLPRDARAWKANIKRTFDEPFAFMINTDYHFDHMMTDCLLCDRVIAHMLAEPAFLAQDGEAFEQMVSVFFPDIDPAERKEVTRLRTIPPFITFRSEMALNLGARRFELIHVGGHTPATTVVHLPEESILFTGDTHVHDRHPFPGDADLLEWIQALDKIERMDVETMVPGHGEVCDSKSVARLRGFFEEMKSRVLDLMGKGCAQDEVEERVDLLSYFPVEAGKEMRTRSFIRLGVGRMYLQLTELSKA